MNAFKTIAISIMLVMGPTSISVARAGSAAEKPAFISVEASKLKWVDAPSVGPGAKIALIEGDLKAAEPFTFRLKLPPNLKVGVHTHPTFERVTIISGSLYFAIGDKFDTGKAKEYKLGDAFVVPSGMPMYGYTKNQEAVLQIHGTGPWGISFLNPADDPKKK